MDHKTALRAFVLGALDDDNGVKASVFESIAMDLPELDPELNGFLFRWIDGADDRVYLDNVDHEYEYNVDFQETFGVKPW